MTSVTFDRAPTKTAIAHGTAGVSRRSLPRQRRATGDRLLYTALGLPSRASTFTGIRDRRTGPAEHTPQWPGSLGVAGVVRRRPAESGRIEPRRPSSQRPAGGDRSFAQRRRGVSECHGIRAGGQADSGSGPGRQSSRALRARASRLTMSHLAFPNESAEYRRARNTLLAEEIALRQHIEAVAVQRRALPQGGEVPEDYVFERIGENGRPEKIEMSKLFVCHDTLITYSFMYGPDRDTPCPMCMQLLETIDGGAKAHPPARRTLHCRQVADRAPGCLGARAQVGSPSISLDGRQQLCRRLFRDSSKVPAALRKDPWREGRRGVGRHDVQRVSSRQWRRAALLGQRAHVDGVGARSGSSIGRCRECVWGLLDMTPAGRGQFVAKLAY